ncbi:MAG: transcription antitermination factor NusB [Nannocystaceae bacterium]
MHATPPTEPQSDRARSRELALLILCHLESYPPDEHAQAVRLILAHAADEADTSDLGKLSRKKKVRAYAQRLVDHVITHWTHVDASIEGVSRTWRLSRMGRVDRNVLRLAAGELERELTTPRGVVLAEAVRLGTRYGSERSGPFVNGVVESLARDLRKAVDHGGT